MYWLICQYFRREKGYKETVSPNEQYVIANECEWFVQDSKDNWIKYGQASPRRNESFVVSVHSRHLEENYFQCPRDLFHTESKSQKYTIDFIRMVQTNSYQKTERKICRKINFSSLQYLPLNSKFYWYFLDENNYWIMFGTINGNIAESHRTQSSDYIELEFNRNPRKIISVSSKVNSYSINFEVMKQTNLATNVIRPICRMQFNSNQQGLPLNWTGMMNATTLECVKLDRKWTEFTTVCGKIEKTLENSTIINVYRIQNPFWWNSFASKKRYLNKQYPSVNYREEILYHGTSKKTFLPFVRTILTGG